MSNNSNDAERRITLLYDEFSRKGDDRNEEFDIERASQELSDLFDKFEASALSREKDVPENSRTRLLGIAAFLRICISDEDDAAIYRYREEQGWVARSIDDAMITGLRLGFTLSDKETPPKEERPDIELGDYEQVDLHSLISRKLKEGVIMAGYAGQLLLLLQKVQAPAKYSQGAIDAARQQAAGRLRRDTHAYKLALDTNPVVSAGLGYINKLVGLGFSGIRSIDDLVLEEPVKSGDQEKEFTENKRKIETLVAYALDELYPTPDAVERNLDAS